MADDTGSIISEIRELVMKTKVHMDFVHVKTGGNLEEIMITRVKALLLRRDEKDKAERFIFLQSVK